MRPCYAADTPCTDLTAEEARGPVQSAEEYSSNQLDILALAFTAIKLLFLLGQLGPLLPIIRYVEEARRASKKLLHETKSVHCVTSRCFISLLN